MTDFLLFIGPWKTLFYGLAIGFALGGFYAIVMSELAKRS